jgi:hypothetical protein
VVFWLWVTLAVLVTPLVAVGLALTMLYLYLRRTYPEFAARLLSDGKSRKS